MNSQQLRPYFLLLLLSGALLLTFFIFKPFLTPLLLAAVFAVILQPLYRNVRMPLSRYPSLAALLTVVLAILVVLVPLTFVGVLVGNEARDLYTSLVDGSGKAELQSVLSQTEGVLVRYVPGIEGYAALLSENIDTYARSGLQWVITHSASAFSSVAGLLLSFFLFFIALYYLLRDGGTVKKTLIELSPLSDRDDELVFKRLELAVNSVVKGNLTIALIQGTLTAVGFALFGVPHAVLWGMVAAFAAIIPGVGTALVFIPAALFLYFTATSGPALGLLLWGVVAVGFIDNFLGPQLVGKGTALHPLLVLLSVLGGLALFGPVGIFLGPLSLSLLFAFLSIYADVSKRNA